MAQNEKAKPTDEERAELKRAAEQSEEDGKRARMEVQTGQDRKGVSAGGYPSKKQWTS
jgi:hypothetical protein